MGDHVIWVGTCGFGRSRADAFRSLDAVEVQETFYRTVSPERAARWAEGAPEGFSFVVKASQFITHAASSPTYRRAGREIPAADAAEYGGFRRTARVEEGWEGTRAVADVLRAKVILFQCPASFAPTPGNVEALYAFFEAYPLSSIRAWEPRGPWPTHIVETVCEDLGLVHATDPFVAEPATTGLAYLRLHGNRPGERSYGHAHTEAELERLRGIAEEYDDAYVMFNNLGMHQDAVRFRRVLQTERGG